MNGLKFTYCTLTAGLSLTILPMMAQHSGNMERELAEFEAAIRASGASTLEEAQEKAKQEEEELSHVTLNIAVTGGSGAGKSSFVNAIRDVPNRDERAAPTGIVECTMTPTMYPHPTMPNVNIWDLPGIGTEKFQAKNYVKDLNLDTYDFFLILTCTRLTEHDIMLAKEIRKNKKKFYFVRTKIDIDVESYKEDTQQTEEQALSVLRQHLEEKLKEFPSAQIFLVSSRKLNKFDFHKMMCMLEKDLPEKKRDALTLSLPVYSMEILDKKYKAFQREIWIQAIGSGAVGAIPAPGLSALHDISVTLSFLTKVYYSFGLDKNSVKQLSERVRKPIPADFSNSKLVDAIATRSLIALQVELAGVLVLEGIEESLRFIPILGSVAGACMSFCSTYLALRKGLDELYKISQNVVEMANLK